jgi:bleomycin hydrolase
MNIIGVDTDNNDVPTRWLIENSWGNAGYNGKLIMTDEWMDEYLFRLVVNKKYFSAETLKLLEQKPILLPSGIQCIKWMNSFSTKNNYLLFEIDILI